MAASGGDMSIPAIHLELPKWLGDFFDSVDRLYKTPAERMRLAIRLSELNITHKTGGPFGAAIFDRSGKPVSVGVNLVEKSRCSLWHAEIVAIAAAQARLGRFDLGNGGKEHFELVTSTEPCAMCLGAIPWSGITRLVCGAKEEDARKVGFDEGAKPADWPGELLKRGITVEPEILRKEAAAVLIRYVTDGGIIYNGRPA